MPPPGTIRDPATPTGDTYAWPDIENPSAMPYNPMGSVAGMVGPNPHMSAPNRGEEFDRTPIIFNRFATRWGDMQLKNGLANGVASGRINSYRGEGWYDVTVPLIPGQTRLIGGGNPGAFVPKGGAPSQWQDNYNQGPGSQPMYPGGPGYLAAPEIYNPGSGG
jgi:hypothetical protein